MSDARPITDISEFVCGNCWQSFGDPEATSTATCPHCGHQQSANQRITESLQAIPSSSSDVGAAELGFSGGGVSAPGATGRPTVAYRPSTEDAATLVPTQGDDSQESSLPEELSVSSLDEVTSPDHVATLAMAGIPVTKSNVTDDAEEASPSPLQLAEAALDAKPEPTEWRLKAPPGLTYNFHSLDAMVGWVGTKDPTGMQLSIEPDEWRPFEPFLAAYRAGLGTWQAWDEAQGRPASSAFDEIMQYDAAEEVQHAAESAVAEDQGEAALRADDADEVERRSLKTTTVQPLASASMSSGGAAERGPGPRSPASSEPRKIPPASKGQTSLGWVLGAGLAIVAGVAAALYFLGYIGPS